MKPSNGVIFFPPAVRPRSAGGGGGGGFIGLRLPSLAGD